MNIKLRVAAALAAVVSAVTASGFAFASAGSGSTGPEAPAEGFVVRAEGGNVADFPPDGGEAAKMTDIELKSLPRVDRIALEDGIFVENSEELAKILEDLGS